MKKIKISLSISGDLSIIQSENKNWVDNWPKEKKENFRSHKKEGLVSLVKNQIEEISFHPKSDAKSDMVSPSNLFRKEKVIKLSPGETITITID